MALEEVSFYNVLGEEVSLSNLVLQMIDYYNQKLEVGETKITDFNEGSEIRNLLEAFAVLCYAILEDVNSAGSLPFISLSNGVYLDRIGENPFINLPRIEGSSSTGNVTFTLTDELEEDFTIPFDTLLEDDNGLEYATVDECVILAGELSETVGVTCLSEGADGNIPAEFLNTISDSNVDTSLVSVTNPDEFTGGADYEDDEDYRTRLLENVQSDGFGTIGYYEQLGNTVEGVHDVKLINNNNYTRKVLVNGYSKPTTDAVLLEVLTNYSDVDKIVLGHSFTVDKPSYVTVNLTFDLEMLTEWTSTELSSLVTAIVNGTGYDRVSFEGLNIGEDLTRQRLLDGLSFIDDIQSVSVKLTGQSSEFSSTSVTGNQVVKIGTLTFNQTIVG